ncbi:MAG: hypothetical protein ACYC5G_04780 [Candidatus Doudnabacteria bacterium]
MHLEFSNISKTDPKNIAFPDAPFLNYKPDLESIKATAEKFKHYSNLLIIGNGGSITSSIGLFGVFGTNGKRVEILSTVDPEYIFKLKNELKKEETLVIAISKSGETVSLIESLLHFNGYPLLCITSEGSVLQSIGQKLGAEIVKHPPVGGRFSTFSEVSLLPAAICGLDIEELFKGAEESYSQVNQNNLSLQAASAMWDLEKKGFVDVFMPIYSHSLFPFSSLIVQLCHETFGKEQKGQTYFAHEAPESQHHTNQRFFGGPKNIAGFFITLDNFREDSKTEVPHGLQSLPLKDGSLYELHKIPLSYSMYSEFEGTWEDAEKNNIPAIALHLTSAEPREIGRYIAFWQMYAVYSAVLRNVSPFDQHQVENSKVISWEQRKKFHRG